MAPGKTRKFPEENQRKKRLLVSTSSGRGAEGSSIGNIEGRYISTLIMYDQENKEALSVTCLETGPNATMTVEGKVTMNKEEVLDFIDRLLSFVRTDSIATNGY